MKNNKGFTLIEVIISIAVLSFICIIFLQLFIKAQDIGQSSKNLDKSVIIMNSMIEQIKAINNINSIEESGYFDDCIIDISEHNCVIQRFMDEDFNVLTNVTSGYFVATIELTQTKIVDDEAVGLYLVECKMVKNDKLIEPIEPKELYRIVTDIVIGR